MKEHRVFLENRNFLIQIGQNAKENWELIDSADGFDLWFHLDDKPSGHVIIKEILNSKNVVTNKASDSKKSHFGYPHELITIGAEYCKSQSKYKTGKVTVVYTTIENIKKGKDIGSVTIKNSEYIIL